MRKIILTISLLLIAGFNGGALAQKPPINGVAGPTTSAQMLSIITDPSGSGSLTFGGATVTGSLTSGNAANLTTTGITDSGVQLLTTLPATSVWGNNSSSSSAPAALTNLTLAAALCSAPTYSFSGSTTTGLTSLTANTVDLCTNGNRLVQYSTSHATNYIQVSANATPLIRAQGGTDVGFQIASLGTTGVDLLAGSSFLLRATVSGTANQAVNYFSLSNAITGNAPVLTVDGAAADVGMGIATKGAGVLTISPATVKLTGITVTPTGKQPVCIDTGTGQLYYGSGGSC